MSIKYQKHIKAQNENKNALRFNTKGQVSTGKQKTTTTYSNSRVVNIIHSGYSWENCNIIFYCKVHVHACLEKINEKYNTGTGKCNCIQTIAEWKLLVHAVQEREIKVHYYVLTVSSGVTVEPAV